MTPIPNDLPPAPPLAEGNVVEAAKEAIRRIHHYGYPADERLAADVDRDARDILAPLLAELGTVTGERDAERQRFQDNITAFRAAQGLTEEIMALKQECEYQRERAETAFHAADTRWRQLDLVRSRATEALVRIDTLARNVAEYPDRIPLLIEMIGALYERVNDGSIARLPEAVKG